MLLAIAPLSLSLSLSSDFFRVPQDKENEKTMKSTSNERRWGLNVPFLGLGFLARGWFSPVLGGY